MRGNNMATVRDDWKAPEGTCPTCLMNVVAVAVMNRSGGWMIRERCYCRQINDLGQWPFERDSNAPGIGDFLGLGIALDYDKYFEDAEEQFEEDQETYLDEVDHGWERAHR
jgi:hypothetical protein